jgi:hypothetical protein
MAKGQTIGGQQGGGRRKGGMLPPTGTGPVEVTPDWMQEQQQSARQAPTAVTPAVVEQLPEQKSQRTPIVPEAPKVTLPDPTADPVEQLAVCERGIHGAKARWKAKVDGATEEFIEDAGPFLCWVHEHKLYKLMLDNNGKLYRSFEKYLKEQHDLPRRTGYRITQTLPLLSLLRAAGYQLDDLSSRQVAVLHPVRVQHDADAVVKVWATASQTKKGPQPTPDELEKAKQLLGLSTKPDPDEEPQALPSADADAGAAVERAAKLLVPETVREAVKKDPDRVRLLYRVLGSALTEAGLPVD